MVGKKNMHRIELLTRLSQYGRGSGIPLVLEAEDDEPLGIGDSRLLAACLEIQPMRIGERKWLIGVQKG